MVSLKAKDCPLDVFTFIDKNMPRRVVFVLEYAGSYKLLLNYKEPADDDGSTFRIIKLQTLLQQKAHYAESLQKKIRTKNNSIAKWN